MILDDLVTVTKKRLLRHQQVLSLDELKQTVAQLPKDTQPNFLEIIKQPG